MDTIIYSLFGGDVDEIKVLYSLFLGVGISMRMNFFYGVAYEIGKPINPLSCHPYI